jgi:hypothetical protein
MAHTAASRRRGPPNSRPNVRDANGQALSYIDYESEPGRRLAAKLLSQDEGKADRGEYREAAECEQ